MVLLLPAVAPGVGRSAKTASTKSFGKFYVPLILLITASGQEFLLLLIILPSTIWRRAWYVRIPRSLTIKSMSFTGLCLAFGFVCEMFSTFKGDNLGVYDIHLKFIGNSDLAAFFQMVKLMTGLLKYFTYGIAIDITGMGIHIQ